MGDSIGKYYRGYEGDTRHSDYASYLYIIYMYNLRELMILNSISYYRWVQWVCRCRAPWLFGGLYTLSSHVVVILVNSPKP